MRNMKYKRKKRKWNRVHLMLDYMVMNKATFVDLFAKFAVIIYSKKLALEIAIFPQSILKKPTKILWKKKKRLPFATSFSTQNKVVKKSVNQSTVSEPEQY